MKVLMFGWEYAPLVAGGLGVVCRGMTHSLVNSHGAQVTYVLPQLPEGSTSSRGVRLSTAGLNKLRTIQIKQPLASPYASTLPVMNSSDLEEAGNEEINQRREIYGRDLLQEVEAYANAASKAAQKEDFEIIHGHDWMSAKAAIKTKEKTGKPMVMHVHATEFDRTLNNPDARIFEQELAGLEAADVIIAVSYLTKQKIVENYGILPEKIIVVHNAVERVETKFGPIAKAIHNQDQIVLFLARMTAMKGADYLLQAGKEVLAHMPNTKFLFIGAGDMLERLIEMSAELEIAHKVTFTGFLPHEQVDQAYKLADLFVLPSVSEPFGITPLEAIRNGTPVILSKQSGVSEVLQNTLKVDFWDTHEMANKIIAVLKHGVLAEELSHNSKDDLEKLNWDEQSKKILDVYRQIKSNKLFSTS